MICGVLVEERLWEGDLCGRGLIGGSGRNGIKYRWKAWPMKSEKGGWGYLEVEEPFGRS